jgi:hypothetical protein
MIKFTIFYHLSFWDKWSFNMVSEPKVMTFQLKITCADPHLLKEILNSYVRESVRI